MTGPRGRSVPNEPVDAPDPVAARPVPHDVAAEEALLGAVLLNREAVAVALDAGVGPGDFYVPSHGHVFEAVADLWSRGEPVDPVTVADVLERREVAEQAGGVKRLVALQANTPGIGNAGRYAAIVAEHALLRRLMDAAAEIADLARSKPEDVAGAVEQAAAKVLDLAPRNRRRTLGVARDLLGHFLDHLEAAVERGGEAGQGEAVRTGYLDLDDKIGGFRPGELVVLGARPSVGKTAWALRLATSVAMDSHLPALYLSLEMSQHELMGRAVAGEARVDSSRLRSGKLTEADWPKISLAVGRLAEVPFYVDDSPHVSALDVRSIAGRVRAMGGLGVVVVDYLQLMRGRRAREVRNRQEEVSETARELKLIARELEVPVVALSQLSRRLEERKDKRPILSDLKESGGLEEAADLVVFLYRDEVYDKASPDRGMAEVIVAKNRNGPTGTVQLAFLEQFARFVNMAKL